MRSDALRWEFLRRSKQYRTVWKQWQDMEPKGVGEANLGGERVLLAQRFGLPELYDPAKPPGEWGPEFPPALPILPCSPEVALARSRTPRSARLKEPYGLLIVDLTATNRDIRRHLGPVLDDLRASKAPPDLTATIPPKSWRGSKEEWLSQREEHTVGQVHPHPAPHQLKQIKTYLEVWTDRKAGKTYKCIAQQLFPQSFREGVSEDKKENAIRRTKDYFRKAKKLIDNAAAGEWPGNYY